MSWPTTGDYSEALQYPGTCFVDPELKTASVLIKNKFGLPVGPTGSYAVVYKLGVAARTWAVKCFVSEVVDQHERYAAISDHLSSTHLPYTVGFNYVSEGVRLSRFPRRMFPILKMEWVTGRPLDRYIQENLYDATALHALARKWIDMVHGLRTAGVGHGDLQHGNVIVTNGEFRLLDYDGMTVPQLVGRKSVESGHRNYQHPARVRLAQQLGPDVDNFSAWVILLSIVAVSIDPTLWYRAAAGDENLLFKQQDFEAPEQSEILRQLENTPDAELRALSNTFRYFLYEDDLTKIPPLNGVVLPQASMVTPASAIWIHDHLPMSSAKGTVQPLTPSVPPAWGERTVTFGRAELATLLVLCCLLPLMSSGNALLLSELAAALLSPAVLYATMQSMGPGAEKRRIVRRRANVSGAIQKTERSIRELLDAESRADVDQRTRIAALGAGQQTLAQRERIERDRMHAEAQRAIAAMQGRRSDLAAREVKERSAELTRMQEAYIVQRLSTFPVGRASIEGVSAELKRRLVASGIRTAADVWRFNAGSFLLRSGAWVHVDGFGQVRGQRVVDWIQGCRATVARNAPRAIDSAKDAEIRRRYEAELRTLAGQEVAATTKAQQDAQAIAGRYRQQQDGLSQQVYVVRQQIAAWKGENQQKIHAHRQTILRLRSELASLDADLRRYAEHTYLRYIQRVVFLSSE